MLEKFTKGKNKNATTKATDREAYMGASVPAWEKISMGVQRSRGYTALMQRFTGWVYAAAMINARGVASQPIKLYSMQPKNGMKSIVNTKKVSSQKAAYLRGEMETKPSIFVQRKMMNGCDVVEVHQHPVLELLDNPSPEMDGYTLAVQRMLNLQLTGNAYLHPIVSETIGVPIELWNMQSDLVSVVPDGQMDLVNSYTYGKQPNAVEFRKDEDNQARPDWAIMVKEHLTDGQYQRLMQQVERQLGGKNNRSRPFIFEGGTDGKPMSFSPQDLAFDSGEKRKIEVIAAIAGVPVTKLKANDPNLANAREGNLGWLRDTIVPYLTLDESFLNRQLLPMFGMFADTLFLAYDDPVSADRSQQATIDASDINAGIKTRNEVRAERGLEPISEGGDELFVPAGSVPIDIAIEQARNPQPMFGQFSKESPDKEKSDDKNAELIAELQQLQKRVEELETIKAPTPVDGKCPDGWHYMAETNTCMEGSSHPSETYSKANDCVSEKISILMAEGYERDQAVAIAYAECGEKKKNQKEEKSHDCNCKKKHDSTKELWDESRSLISQKRAPIDSGNNEWETTLELFSSPMDDFRDDLVRLFGKEIEQFLGFAGGMGEFTTSADAQQEIREITNRFVDDVMLTSGQRELDRLGVDLQFNRLDPVIADTLEQYKSQLVETLIFGTGKEIADKVDLGMRHGASTDEIADDIRSLLQAEPETGRIPIEARAEMIARTEVALINEIGRLDAWNQSGVVAGKQWVVADGACESCNAMGTKNPNPIGIKESFADAGERSGKVNVWTPTGGGLQTPPLHPNCRCTMVEILDDEDLKTRYEL